MKCSLLDFLEGERCIEGYTQKELEDILTSSVLFQLGDDELLLPNGKTLKCIRNYYAYNGNKAKANATSDITNCQIAKNFYKINEKALCECQVCHLACLNKAKNYKKEYSIKI